MIKIAEKKKNKKATVKPHYELVYNYMIGDANGNTTEEVELSIDNPYIERYCTLLGKLKPTPGHWGVMLEAHDMYEHVEAKQITNDDYHFLERMMFEHDEDDEIDEKTFIVEEENEDFADEFYPGVSADTEYSFLVFQGVDLWYIDEYGEKHGTYFEKPKK